MILEETITEYDIKSCNINVMLDHDMIDRETYDKLNNGPKDVRNIKVGLMFVNRPKWHKKFTDHVNDVVDEFVRVNELDGRILSRVNDAIWVIGAIPSKTKMTDNVEFIPKNRCNVIYIYKQIAFHLDTSTGKFFIKGLGKTGGMNADGSYRNMTKFVERCLRLYINDKQEILYSRIHKAVDDYLHSNDCPLHEPMKPNNGIGKSKIMDLNYKILIDMIDVFIKE